MRVALVHDWLTGMRGGEAVLEPLCRLLPEAPLFTLVHVKGSVAATIESRPIRESFVGRLPFGRTRYRSWLPLFPLAIETLDLSGFDLIVSTSHCVAKGAIAAPGARHVCYCHTPVRYAWDRFHDYFGPRSGAGVLDRVVARLACHYLRLWDAATASRVDRYVANSRFVASRIRRYYGRESEVIHPPVDAARFQPDPRGPEDYYLVVAALAPYKRITDAIDACAQLGRRLVIAGTGPERRALERRARRAGAKVDFLGWVAAPDLPGLYARARALLFPGVEDFGITPLESMATGRPVIALGEGGALETVAGHGITYAEPGPAGLAAAIRSLEAREAEPAFAPARLRARALEFDRPVFEAKIRRLLESEGLRLPAPDPVPSPAC